jgi:hypothetical protein
VSAVAGAKVNNVTQRRFVLNTITNVLASELVFNLLTY